MANSVLKTIFIKQITQFSVFLFLSVSSFSVQAEPFTGLTPVSPQPVSASIAPGLAVQYFSKKFNNLKNLDDWMGYKNGVIGKPLNVLNINPKEKTVLTTTKDPVGADIVGYIKMSNPGRYIFKVQSNNIVYLAIGNKLIYEDLEGNEDNVSDELVVEISKLGWYPINIRYLKNKAAAILAVYWEAPGGSMEIIPTSALAHLNE